MMSPDEAATWMPVLEVKPKFCQKTSIYYILLKKKTYKFVTRIQHITLKGDDASSCWCVLRLVGTGEIILAIPHVKTWGIFCHPPSLVKNINQIIINDSNRNIYGETFLEWMRKCGVRYSLCYSKLVCIIYVGLPNGFANWIPLFFNSIFMTGFWNICSRSNFQRRFKRRNNVSKKILVFKTLTIWKPCL